jgi:glycosyltransferase involved in cell wall biosynthesis
VLRIGMDVTPAITGSTGIARYVTEVSDGLGAGAVVQRFAIGRGVIPAPSGTRHLRLPLRVVDRLWTSVGRPRLDTVLRHLTSVHASGPVLPPARCPVVAVVHDLAPLLHPELHPPRDVEQLRRYLRQLDRAAAVITVSATTADRLVGLCAPPIPVHVVPNGLSQLPPPVSPPLAGRPYVLAIGAPVPRKGFDALLRAVARLDDRDLAVAIVGPPGPDDAPLQDLAAQLGLDGRFHRAGPASLAELAGWYSSAAVVAAPSIDEGFGLPVIEALSLGTPVIASDIAAFREVSDGHARLVPVGDVAALAEAIADAVSRPSRDAEGMAHARQYSWSACTDRTLAVHRLVSA